MEQRKQLGQILCETTDLTQAQLEYVLVEQEGGKKGFPLGEILLGHGYITEEQLQNALVIQKEAADRKRILQR
jgi:hypothetical protein